jgi:hypothetical protein
MSDLEEIKASLTSIENLLGQILDPWCECEHRSSRHSWGGGVCLAGPCPCSGIRKAIRPSRDDTP